MRRFLAVNVVVAVWLALIPSGRTAESALPLGARCAEGPLARAASALFGAGSDVVGRRSTAGLDGALVLEPRIAPGTRARLLEVGASWCEASSSFNLAWKHAGRAFDADAAAAYARIAAAPYFDRVTVEEIDEIARGTFEIATHALTNGIDARWVVSLDDSGIRTATWTATAFAQEPLVGEMEGLTALPGATETYTRTIDGLLSAVRGLPEASDVTSAAPGLAEYVSPDDFHIVVSVGDSRVAIDPGMDTGVRKADIVRETMAAIETNYEEFHSWGLRKGWGELEPISGPDKGYVYINDALSLYCFACVFIADDFQIHILSEVEAILSALGYSYPDSVKAFQNVIGHEMFHNFQNRYNKPGPLGRSAGRGVTASYSEGTARAQETLHGYADVSFQEQSLVYAQDANGCNGFDGASMDAALVSGIFNKTYNTCFFWLSWYAAEGIDGLVRLVSKAYPKASPTQDGSAEGIKALAIASSASPAEQLARFAGAAITGRGYRDPVARRNWGRFLDRWEPLPVAVGDTAAANLAQSGMFARELEHSATVTLKRGSKATLFVVIDDGSRTRTRVVGNGSICLTHAAGEKIWVGAARIIKGSGLATIKTSKASCS